MERAHKSSSRQNVHVLEGRYFEPANDVGPLVEVSLFKLVVRAFAIAMATLLFGGAVLSQLIVVVAVFFNAPEFAELKYMGFTMSGVLGSIFATWFLFYHSSRAQKADFRLIR